MKPQLDILYDATIQPSILSIYKNHKLGKAKLIMIINH